MAFILSKESVVVWSWREESNLQPAVYKNRKVTACQF